LVSDSRILVSDSRVLVSDSLFLIRGKFLIRGLFKHRLANILSVVAACMTHAINMGSPLTHTTIMSLIFHPFHPK